jgi:6-pyruvoyltetrahydropterin/6-carboxytetrahydropterin synthase
MRITITKAFEFEACHHLEGYNGDCSRMHGHSYKLEVTVANTTERQLPQSDMVVDFKELSQVVKESVLVDYDHRNLDELFGEEQRATAENMAIDIAARLDEAFEDTTVKVVKIRLYETSTSYVELICE